MKSDRLMNALFAALSPGTDEISNARSDPGAARISRLGSGRIELD